MCGCADDCICDVELTMWFSNQMVGDQIELVNHWVQPRQQTERLHDSGCLTAIVYIV